MDKIRFLRLWDLYGGLLTETQREITGLYLNLDLTVSEIAEEKGTSRQSVSECLNLCKRQLEEYEERLGHEKILASSDLHISFLVDDICGWAEEFLKLHPEYVRDIEKLKKIAGRDYSKEIEEKTDKLQGETGE